MDDITLKRLQNLLGEDDVWEEPKAAVDPPSKETQPTMGSSSYGPEGMEEGTFDYNFGRSENQQQSSSRRCKGAGRGGKAKTSTNLAVSAGPKPTLAELEKVRLPIFSGKMGDVSPQDMRSTALSLAIHYPNQYIGHANREKAAPFFKRDSLLDTQAWDFFYVWHPNQINR